MPAEAGEVFRELTIVNKLGLHARPAALFVKLAIQFQSDIFVEKGNERVNAKSIMGIMMLAAAMGTRIKIIARGPDAEQALDAFEKLLQSKFGEE